MSRWGRRVLVVTLSLLGGAAFASDVVLAYLNRGQAQTSFAVTVGFDLAMLAFGTTGLVMIAKRTGNAIGWLFCWISLGALIGDSIFQWGLLTFRDTGSTSGAAAVMIGQQMFGGAVVTVLLILLLFPTGRLPSPRWRIAGSIFALAIISGFVVGMTDPRPIPLSDGIPNPFAVEAGSRWWEILNGLVGWAFLPAILFALAAPLFRFRRATDVERQQLKWFAYSAAACIAFGFPINALLASMVPELADVGFVLAMAILPIGIGIAILRYRLYDIDFVVNRTLVYVALTAGLVITYLVVVVALQGLLSPLTTESDLAVAGSTLAVAALFRPLRAGVQSFIDRRFYRRKYDAAETMDRFSSRLRNEVELDSLTRELVIVVGSTMQPSHASLWIKKSAS